MRVAIAGVGGVGAMAAWRLAKAGHTVIGLERFALDHDQGSSYGESRIVRRVYPDALYTALMADAYALWDELQGEETEEIFRRAGGIYCGPADHPLVQQAEAALAASDVPYEKLSAGDCLQRFPAFVLEPHEVALHEPSMGYARASNAVRAAVRQARKLGAQIEENAIVTQMEALPGGGVRLTTSAGASYEADRLLICAGAWAKPLLEPFGVTLPLVVTRQPYVHLLPAQFPEAFAPGNFPVWIDAGNNAYGFPHLGAIPGVKFGLHDHGANVTPGSAERRVQPEDLAGALAYAARRFPWLSQTVAYEKVCLYTNTPDEDFILDQVPGLPDALLISACSGHGFKFTPLMGQIATDLLTDGASTYDLSRFRLSRFAPTA